MDTGKIHTTNKSTQTKYKENNDLAARPQQKGN